MIKYRLVLVLFISLFFFSFYSPDEKYVRRAMHEMEKGNLKQARFLYEKAIEKNPDNYWANLGMGLLLSDMLGNYSGAEPYLQKAFDIADKDTVPALMYALAKCYQHNGQYEKALTFYERLGNYRDDEEEVDLEKDIKKRKDDCRYGIQNRGLVTMNGWQIVNAGRNINSEMPEYVPVITGENELIFTSRRKDDKREQLSYLDGKYFESMYISKIEKAGFEKPRRYTLPDLFLSSHYLKKHESVISMSPDGKKLFVFRDNKIFEIGMDERKTKNPRKMLKTINFDFYQDHAFLTKDGNTLYFTSEAKGGIGGIDIYRSTKIREGEWSKPENIGAPVNTPMDEDAPFVSEDGKTLYFASTGHKGYGNYDIFKSEMIDGKWSEPVNLGEPVNSPGHDIFLVLSNDGTTGYFSSSRGGGLGDMDIYKINVLDKAGNECPAANPWFTSLKIEDDEFGDFKNNVRIRIPGNFKIYRYEWKVNDEPAEGSLKNFEHDYKKEGNYLVSAKFTAYCDTCLAPVVACLEVRNNFERIIVQPSVTPVVVAPVKSGNNNTAKVNFKKQKGELSAGQMVDAGFDSRPVWFDFNEVVLKDAGMQILRTNSEVLKKNRSLKVEIYGHSDSRGDERANQLISLQRAINTRTYLINQGVKASQIKLVLGKGSSDLLNDCVAGKECDDSAHQENRRVVFKVFAN